MADLDTLREDRRMRNAAKRLVTNDIDHLRSGVEEKGLVSRAALRMQEGAEGVGEDVATFARQNPGRFGSMIAIGAAVLAGWIFRKPLSEAIDRLWQFREDDEADETHDAIDNNSEQAPALPRSEYDTQIPSGETQ